MPFFQRTWRGAKGQSRGILLQEEQDERLGECAIGEVQDGAVIIYRTLPTRETGVMSFISGTIR
jgi:hypothetical protein